MGTVAKTSGLGIIIALIGVKAFLPGPSCCHHHPSNVDFISDCFSQQYLTDARSLEQVTACISGTFNSSLKFPVTVGSVPYRPPPPAYTPQADTTPSAPPPEGAYGSFAESPPYGGPGAQPFPGIGKENCWQGDEGGGGGGGMGGVGETSLHGGLRGHH